VEWKAQEAMDEERIRGSRQRRDLRRHRRREEDGRAHLERNAARLDLVEQVEISEEDYRRRMRNLSLAELERKRQEEEEDIERERLQHQDIVEAKEALLGEVRREREEQSKKHRLDKYLSLLIDIYVYLERLLRKLKMTSNWKPSNEEIRFVRRMGKLKYE
jgi:hypothetical protein